MEPDVGIGDPTKNIWDSVASWLRGVSRIWGPVRSECAPQLGVQPSEGATDVSGSKPSEASYG
jgi:hypothetical protein